MAVKVLYNEVVSQTCGVGVLGLFREKNPGKGWPKIDKVAHKGGCGWVISGFTNKRPDYKQAYDALCKRWGKPVYQSPVRRNTRTGNQFFFAIWDTRK